MFRGPVRPRQNCICSTETRAEEFAANHSGASLRFGSSLVAWLLASLILSSTGCSTFGLNFGGLGSRGLVQELETENERLLTEFRAERDRREQVERELRLMENRLAESEKLLARKYTPTSSRLSQLNSVRSGRSFGGPTFRAQNFGGSNQPFSSDLRGIGGSGSQYGTADGTGLRWRRRAGQ